MFGISLIITYKILYHVLILVRRTRRAVLKTKMKLSIMKDTYFSPACHFAASESFLADILALHVFIVLQIGVFSSSSMNILSILNLSVLVFITLVIASSSTSPLLHFLFFC